MTKLTRLTDVRRTDVCRCGTAYDGVLSQCDLCVARSQVVFWKEVERGIVEKENIDFRSIVIGTAVSEE